MARQALSEELLGREVLELEHAALPFAGLVAVEKILRAHIRQPPRRAVQHLAIMNGLGLDI